MVDDNHKNSNFYFCIFYYFYGVEMVVPVYLYGFIGIFHLPDIFWKILSEAFLNKAVCFADTILVTRTKIILSVMFKLESEDIIYGTELFRKQQ